MEVNGHKIESGADLRDTDLEEANQVVLLLAELFYE